MASRRDLFQSYQFMVQRVISGIVLRETDPLQTPLRKMIGSGFASFMIAAVALGGTTLIGVFFKSGNTEWQTSEKVIIEAETGAKFVYQDLTDDGKDNKLLHPMTNFVSAALLVGTRDTVEVSQLSLRDAPRGPRLGLFDVPDSIPEPEQMLGGPWTLCSIPATEEDTGELVPNTALAVGQATTEGADIKDDAVIVRDIELNSLHLVWNGHQFPIPRGAEDAVLEGLTLRTKPQIQVGTAWLNAVPIGAQLRPYPVVGRGEMSTAVPGAIVGEVRVVESLQGRLYYQVARNQIIEITQVQARILLGDPAIRDTVYAGRPPTELPLTAAEANLASSRPLAAPEPTDPPREEPGRAEVTSEVDTVCASFQDDRPTPQIAVRATVQGAENATATQSRTEEGTVLADRVLVEPGFGAIVQEQASTDAVAGTRYLITDEGRRYPLSPDIQTKLGYENAELILLPTSLVARVPLGDALDPAIARQRVN